MLAWMNHSWRKRMEETGFLRRLVFAKVVFVVLLLLLVWALREKDTVVAYMRF